MRNLEEPARSMEGSTPVGVRNKRLAASLLMLSLIGCPTPTPPPRTGPEGTAPASQVSGSSPTINDSAASTADISGEVILTLSMNNMDTVLSQGLSYVRPHLPGAFAAMLQPSMLKAQMFKAMNIPELEGVVDTARPWAAAMADPARYPDAGQLGTQLNLLAVPVSDPQGLADILGKTAGRHERTPYGDHLFDFGGQQARMRLVEGYALVAGHERLLNGAAAVLLPLVKAQGASSSAGRLRVDLAAVNRLYGDKLDRALSKLQRQMNRQPQSAGVGKMVTRWVGYLRSTDELTLELALETASIRATTTLAAAQSGEFPRYLAGIQPGPAWGAKYLPADSGVVMLSRQTPNSLLEGVDQGLDALRGLLGGVTSDKTFDAVKQAARQGAMQLTGESAAAMWVNADGGVGLQNVARVKDGRLARAETVKLMQLVSVELKRILTSGLPPKARKELKGFNVDLAVRPGALRLVGLQGDLVEVNIRWPRLKGPMQQRLQQIRKRLTKILGPRITLAMASSGDLMMITAGKDFRPRMARLYVIARGGAPSSMEQTIAGIVNNRRIAGLVYVPVASLAEQGMRLAEQVTEVPTQVTEMFQKLLPPPGSSVPVSAVVQAAGPKLTLELNISPDLLGMIAKGALAAFTGRAAPPTP